MQLLYLWVKEYKCFKEQGFNFSSKHKFEFSYNNLSLKYSKNQKCIDNFFSSNFQEKLGNISELTAIVGNNGAGKSTLIDIIIETFIEENTHDTEIVYCFINNDKNIEVYSNILNIKLDTLEENKKYFSIKKYSLDENYQPIETYIKDIDFNKLNSSTSFIYYSNIFDSNYNKKNRYFNIHKFYDISTIELIKNNEIDIKDFFEKPVETKVSDCIRKFFEYDFRNQIEFICDFKESGKYIGFNLPNHLNIKFIDLENIIKIIYSWLYNKDGANLNPKDRILYIKELIINRSKKLNDNEYERIKLLYCILTTLFVIKNTKFKTKDKYLLTLGNNLLYSIFIVFIHNIISRQTHEKNVDLYRLIRQTFNESFNNTLRNYDDINKAFNYLMEKIDIIIKDSKIPFNNNFVYNIKKLKKYMNKFVFANSISDFYLDITKKGIKIKEFYDLYRETAMSCDYLEFSWNMSTGEYNMISLFSRFYSIVAKEYGQLMFASRDNNTIKDIIILVDEADISFHPEWQQKYIKKFLEFLQIIYNKYNIQVIITTHSPIMLSDIPNDNVIFLKKQNQGYSEVVIDNKIKTFGSNIYNLYREGFFLDGSNLGVMGDFAKDKIKEVEDILSSLESDITNSKNELILNNVMLRGKLTFCKKVIDMIGEDLIHNMLLEKYNKIYQSLKPKKNSDNLNKLQIEFDNLSKDEQNELIRYIIDNKKNL